MTQVCNNLDTIDGVTPGIKVDDIQSQANQTAPEESHQSNELNDFDMVYCDSIITFSEVAKERNLTQDQISQEDPKDTVKPPEEKHTRLSPEYSRVKDLQKKIHRKENFRKTRIERDKKLTINLLDTWMEIVYAEYCESKLREEVCGCRYFHEHHRGCCPVHSWYY